MAVFKIKDAPRNTNQSTSDDFQKAEFWANIGYYEELDGERVFIALTRGVPLDAGILKDMSGNSEMAKLKNGLNRAAREAAMELEPGQAEEIVELTVQLRRADMAAAAAPPAQGGISKLTFGPRA